MATEFCEILITAAPLKIPAPAFRADAGAVVDFCGVVRDGEASAKIDALDYEAHTAMAEHQLRKIADEARGKFGVHTITLHHRIGRVPVAEPSLFLRVSARHREPALGACAWIIERLKADVPIWKREFQVSDFKSQIEKTARVLSGENQSGVGNLKSEIPS